MPCQGCPIGPGCRGEVHRRWCERRDEPEVRSYLMARAGLNPDLPHDPATVAQVRVDPGHRTAHAPRSTFAAAAPGKVRLGFLCPNLNSGGAESVQLQMLKGLDQSKFTFVGLICVDPMAATDASMVAATSGFVPIQFGLDKLAALASQCDVLVSWAVEDMGRWLGGATTPFVYIDHFPHDGPLGPIARYCLRDAAAVVGVSALCSPAWADPAWSGRYAVIPNAVDAGRLAVTRTKAQMFSAWGIPALTTGLGVGLYPPVVGSYCRIHLDRRPDAVIRALPALPLDYHAVVIGEQNSPDELQALTNMVGQMPAQVRSRVHILPADPASGDVLNALDVLVSAPSGVTESFGLSACEALWSGKPVVATPFGVAKLHPEYFYAVALDDTPANLAAAIVRAFVGGCPAKAQAFVRSAYAAGNFVAAWSALLLKVAGQPLRVPALTTQAVSFARAMIVHATGGFEMADEATVARREAECQTCPLLIPPDTCSSCGCNLRAKRALESSACPIGRW